MNKVLLVLCFLALVSACGGGDGVDNGGDKPASGSEAVDKVNSYNIGGSLSGLEKGEQVVLQNNGDDNLTVSSDGAFVFTIAIADSGGYAVSVFEKPSTKSCTVSDGTGIVSGANVTDISIVCSANAYTADETTESEDNDDQTATAINYVPKFKITSIDIDYGYDTIIGLDDGTYWQTFDSHAWTWLQYDDVVTCGFDMVNLDRDKDINVSWNSGNPNPFMCELKYRYGVKEILDDGKLLKLDDGSEWEISSFDAFTTKQWTKIMDTIVITSDQMLINMDEGECVQGNRND